MRKQTPEHYKVFKNGLRLSRLTIVRGKAIEAEAHRRTKRVKQTPFAQMEPRLVKKVKDYRRKKVS